METLEKLQNQDTVSEVEFSTSKSMWKVTVDSQDGRMGKVILPEFFDIPLVDLVELLEEKSGKNGTPKAVKARAYIGLQEYDPLNKNYEMKLFIVGVDKNNDPILTFTVDGDGLTETTKEESAIYDMITPCPPTCPK